jgi:Glyoxalase/Bleomycin resistance protein/Dioxygenase superfamily.
MIHHAGLTITDPTDIINFYQDILGLKIKKEFTLKKELNQQLFGFYEDVPVTMLSNGKADIEIFVTDLPARNNYSHLCIEVEDRNEIIKKVKEKTIAIRLSKEIFTRLYLFKIDLATVSR